MITSRLQARAGQPEWSNVTWSTVPCLDDPHARWPTPETTLRAMEE
jgi:hypothetical protein